MSGSRRLRILGRLVDRSAEVGHEDPGFETRRLCEVSAEVTGMSGAGVMLMSADVPRGSLCSSDGPSALIEQLQNTLGEGPCVDAHIQGRPVVEPDLCRPVTARWPAFSEGAIQAGVRAVFGFPLHVGAVRLGALNLYRDQPGSLSADQTADALVMANIAAQVVLVLQADAPPGGLADELEAGADFQYVVHQAAGMVAVQMNVSVGQALVRLRAHAFRHDRLLADIAREVVARRLRFSQGGDASEER